MRSVTREVSVTTRRGFTIIELMVVLALIGLVCYLSMPRVEEWIVRQQARQFIAQFISDFSKAVSLSRWQQNLDGNTAGGSAITRAAFFVDFSNPRRYYLLTRTSATAEHSSWSPTTDGIFKQVDLPSRLQIYDFNNINQGTVVLQFTPAGGAYNGYGTFSSPVAQQCGTGSQSTIPAPLHAMVVLRADLYFSQPIFYQIVLNTAGQYGVCLSVGNNTFNESSDREIKSQ